jgi:hypothetical protein
MQSKRLSWLCKLAERSLRASGTAFLLSLPVAYLPDSTDQTQVVVGAYGGGGQAATIIRDCVGNPISSSANGFGEVSGVAAVVVPLAERSNLVVTAKAGYIGVNWRLVATPSGSSSPRLNLNYSYFNPSVAWESRYVGLGIGAIFGDIPVSLDFAGYDDVIPISGHLRFGQIDKVYFNFSVMENIPLASGGGLVDVGLGYTVSRRLQMYSAFTAGFYEQPGFLQQARIRLGHRAYLDLAGRAGGADGIFEYGLSAGLMFRLGGE